jgi:hypothetical protein
MNPPSPTEALAALPIGKRRMAKVGEAWQGLQGAMLNILWCVAGTYKVHLTLLAPATGEIIYVKPMPYGTTPN